MVEIKKRKISVWRILGWLILIPFKIKGDIKAVFHNKETVKLPHTGNPFYIDPFNERMSRDLMTDPEMEPNSAILLDAANTGEHILDIGAGIGFYTTKLENRGSVIAANETNPEDMEMLRMNVNQAGEKVELYKEVIGSREPNRLDNFCASKFVGPSFIRINAYGMEYEVMRGSSETIRKYQPSFFMKLRMNGEDRERTLWILQLFKRSDYVLRGIAIDPIHYPWVNKKSKAYRMFNEIYLRGYGHLGRWEQHRWFTETLRKGVLFDLDIEHLYNAIQKYKGELPEITMLFEKEVRPDVERR